MLPAVRSRLGVTTEIPLPRSQRLTRGKRTDDDAPLMTPVDAPIPFDTAALVPRVLARDPQALDLFYRREHPTVYRLCFGFLADPGAAEDVAHDALHRLIEALPAFDRSRPYTAWRNTLVLNLCRDLKRREEARSRAENRAAQSDLEFGARHRSDPVASAADAEIRSLLLDALRLLSEREREVFVLRDLEGQESSDVAASLGITEGTVRSLLCLARRRLRDVLGERIRHSGGDSPPRDEVEMRTHRKERSR